MKASAQQALRKTRLQQSHSLQRILLYVCFATLALICSLPGLAQDLRVAGKVTGDNGQPVSRASISVKDANTGVTADDNGNFEITAPANGTLIISAINFTTQEVKINNRQTLNITLVSQERTETEVIVVGYGTQRRRDVTGSIVSVTGQQLREVPAANVVQMLQGRAAGVDIARNGTRPGAGGIIRIRGNRSLSGNNDPLLVVDGVPYSGDVNDLNPDEIASIEVLKDASATAIYGSRGSNGVFLITTRRGKVGPPQISYNTYFGFIKEIDQYKVFEAEDFTQVRQLAGEYTSSPEETQGIANGTNTNWQDYLYDNGHVMNHDINVTGGSEGTTYRLGGGYMKEKGIIPGQSFERFSLSTGIETKIGKRLRVGLTSLNTLSYTNGEGLGGVTETVVRMSPLLPAYNADGSINLYPRPTGVELNNMANPLTLKTKKDLIVDRRRRMRTFNSLFGEYEIIKGLKYRINVGLDFRQDNYGTYRGAGTIANPGLQGDQVVNPLLNNARVSNGEAWTYTIDNLLMYERTFATKHRFGVTLLYGVQEDRAFETTIQGQGLPSDAVQYYNFGLTSTPSTVNPNAGNFFAKQGLVSMMGRVNYVFDNKYSLTATFRRDGSSVFPEGTWFNYPAFAAAWTITNERFMANNELFENLKLRVGWGQSGNQGIPANATTATLSNNFYNFGTTGFSGYYVGSLGNRDLEWESTDNINVGLDFAILHNRITGSIDWYRQNTEDLLVQRALPASNGAGSFWTNAASVKGKGIEITLSSANIVTKDFKWSTDINFSINKEEITELEEPGKTENIGNRWFVGQPIAAIYDYVKVGIWQQSEAAEALTFGRVPGQIKLADLDKNGVINAADRQVIGTAQPDWIGGMTNRLSYKAFDLSIVAFARMGGTLIATYLQNDGTNGGFSALNSGRTNAHWYDYWTPNNPTNSFPKPASGNTLPYSSTLGYHDASFIKIRSINLGYNLPHSLLSKAGITSARVYVTAQNPFIVYAPFKESGLGIDPEGNRMGGTNGGGSGYILGSQGETLSEATRSRYIAIGLTTPPTRQFNIGLNLKF